MSKTMLPCSKKINKRYEVKKTERKAPALLEEKFSKIVIRNAAMPTVAKRCASEYFPPNGKFQKAREFFVVKKYKSAKVNIPKINENQRFVPL